MAKKPPWHSINENVYHDDTNCKMASKIEKQNIRHGTGGRPLCNECARIRR